MPWMVTFSRLADQRFAEAQRVIPQASDLRKALVALLSHNPFTNATTTDNGLYAIVLPPVSDALPLSLSALYDVGDNQKIMVKNIRIS